MSQDDINLLVTISNYKVIAEVARQLEISTRTVYNRFDKICNKLAFYLGDEYTNFGYIEYLKSKHSLNEQQVTQLMRRLLKDNYGN